MPKVTYKPSSGLVQATGAGLNINSITSIATDTNLDATTFLTVATAAIANVVLPATADTGAIKVIIADTDANHVVVKGTNCTTGDLNLTNFGDFVIAVYNGTEWVVGRSLG